MSSHTGSQERPRPARRPSGQASRLLVVRHGRTAWNASGRWQGRADIPLDEAGQQEAAAAALALGTFDAIWSSHLQRAWHTAQIIAEIHGVGPVSVDERLAETEVGPWEGLNFQQVEEGWPGYLASKRRPEGFESYDDASARVLAALRDIAAAHPGGEILVVSHGGVMRAVRRALGAHDPHFANLGGSWYHVDPSGDVVAGDVVTVIEPPGGSGDSSNGSRG